MARHNVIGQKGELIVARFLKRKGFTILDTNYWRKWGEIDIVVMKEGKVHFIEVKTSTRNLSDVTHVTKREVLETILSSGHRPEENVHYSKRERLKRVIQTYLLDKGIVGKWQVDLVVVYIDDSSKKALVDLISNIIL